MKKLLNGTLGALMLSIAGTGALANGCNGSGTSDHTIYVYVFGFVPETTYVCAGDRVRIQNKSYYYMYTTIPDVVEDDGDLQNFSTGVLYPGQTSSWFNYEANGDVTFRPRISGYGNYSNYEGRITLGNAPTAYAPGERYEDPVTGG